MLLNILYTLSGLAALAVVTWAWTAVRTASRDLAANTRRPVHRAGEDVKVWFTPAVDAPVDEPLYGNAAQAVRDALIAKGVPADDLNRRSY